MVGMLMAPVVRGGCLCGSIALCQRRYLREQKGRCGDQGKTYEWGANAEDEITRAKVDDFIRQVATAQWSD